MDRAPQTPTALAVPGQRKGIGRVYKTKVPPPLAVEATNWSLRRRPNEPRSTANQAMGRLGPDRPNDLARDGASPSRPRRVLSPHAWWCSSVSTTSGRTIS